MDCGAGDGKIMAAAIMGASAVHGFELPQNNANKFIFDAAMQRIVTDKCFNQPSLHHAHLEMTDIAMVSYRQ